MDCVQRIGFFIGPYAKLASPDECAQAINNEAKIDCEIIEIKKKTTYKKGVGSKVFILYAINTEASNADQIIHKAEFKRF